MDKLPVKTFRQILSHRFFLFPLVSLSLLKLYLVELRTKNQESRTPETKLQHFGEAFGECPILYYFSRTVMKINI